MEMKMQTIKLNNEVKNDEWTNKDELPDPEVLPNLPGYHVLVRPVRYAPLPKWHCYHIFFKTGFGCHHTRRYCVRVFYQRVGVNCSVLWLPKLEQRQKMIELAIGITIGYILGKYVWR